MLPKSPIRIFTHPYRGFVAAVLLAVYLMISLSPLSSLALHSKSFAHAVTGECSGDCDICGCSPENRAAKTCCCSKKRTQQAANHVIDDTTPDCCKKKTSTTTASIASCGCPCGGHKQVALAGVGSFEIIPFKFILNDTRGYDHTCFNSSEKRLTTRHTDPPDPPPRLASLS